MFWKKKKSRLEILKEAVGSHAHDALESAQGAFHYASDAVHEKLENAPEKIGDFKESAGETLGETISRLQGAVSTLGSSLGSTAVAVKKGAQAKASHLGEAASHLGEETSHRIEDARHLADDKRAEIEKTLKKNLGKKQKQLQSKKQELVRAYVPEVVINDGNDKWIWLGVGILVGAVIGILAAPSSGRRNRALLRDKLAQGAGKAGDLGEAATRKAHDLSNRAEGLAHKVADKVNAKVNGESDDADDVTIADRVRNAFGRLDAAQGLERINVDSNDGVVTLRGPVVSDVTQAALVAAAQKVAGVREVISDLLVDDETEETFVG